MRKIIIYPMASISLDSVNDSNFCYESRDDAKRQTNEPERRKNKPERRTPNAKCRAKQSTNERIHCSGTCNVLLCPTFYCPSQSRRSRSMMFFPCLAVALLWLAFGVDLTSLVCYSSLTTCQNLAPGIVPSFLLWCACVVL